jgi:Tol biopolymer transport system component
MTLAPGARLGPYEIESVLGAGGFGEVYKARDTRLGRQVAVKVLLPAIAADEKFRERFEREARVISQLTHPNICTLFDVGREGATEYLVMEYLEGETLAARLQQGGLQIDETIRTGLQIADALACAHGAGIMHRDLKPANVFLTKNGAKLLDFGLAKAASVLTGGPADVTTPVAHATMTAQGTILGTLQYMAPEQVEGLDVDSRVDIWAFGAILHEMITGRAAFEARTPATLIAAVLTQQPQPVRAVNPEAPPALERLVAGCLEKDRDERWQSIRDVRRQLAAAATAADASVSPALSATAPVSVRRPLSWVGAIGGGILGILAGYGLASRMATTPTPGPLVRFEIRPPAGTSIAHTEDTAQYMAPSPDGTRIAFVASGRLWLKALDGAAATEVAGGNGAESPFWSPDGRAIAFFAGGQLKKKTLDGGPPQVLCSASPSGSNGTWSAAGVILFDNWGLKRIMRVSDEGGTPTVVRSADMAIGWPQFLPDGRHYLFATTSQQKNRAQLMASALDSNDATPIDSVDSRAEFVDGHLLFKRDGALVAQPFDADGLRLSGAAVPLAEFIVGFGSTGYAAFSATPRLLVYQAISPANRMLWVDREGREIESIGQPRDYNAIRLSPDGSAIAYSVRDPLIGGNDIWLHDFRRNIDTRLTTERSSENSPIWTPDGRTIVYAADRKGPPHIHARDVGGSEERQITAPSTAVQSASAITADGRFVLYSDVDPVTGRDVMMAPLDGRAAPVPLVHTSAQEGGARPSPDGRWLAYASNESGRNEVYVRPFHNEQTHWQVSRAGGGFARWRGDGRELFYIEGGTRIMSVDVSAGAAFDVSAPRVLFSRQAFADYDVTADGKKFVFAMLDPEAEAGTINAILNWTSLLRR